MRRTLLAGALAAALWSQNSAGVYLNPEGHGQALIFPAFSTQIAAGNYWNTYLSVVNHTADAKAVRVRVREGRNGREVWNANLYLAPNDVWTAAMFQSEAADTSAAMIISSDRSCIAPPFANGFGAAFSNASFSGARADGFGDGLDRTREGYVEMLEMATLTGASAAAITHNVAGVPANCAFVQGAAAIPAADLRPPTGGLSGSFTLINVSSGMDMGGNAEALADLTVQPFFRAPSDPYPDFDSAEVTPESRVVANGKEYRLTWPRAFDAVSAALMRSEALNEYVLDPGTHSSSTWVVTTPTRRFYAPLPAAPFLGNAGCVSGSLTAYDREGVSARSTPTFCFASAYVAFGPAGVFGGKNSVSAGAMPGTSGWARLALETNGTLASGADSSAWDLATNTTATGRFEIHGLPMVGFAARTFENGLLTCGLYNPMTSVITSGGCQGNYGGSFSHRYRRSINPL